LTLLLDTHFLLWILTEATRLDEFPWLEDHRPWGVSPVAFLELQFLGEIGRLEVKTPELVDAVLADRRFVVDEPPLLVLVRAALDVGWTRDPFDRLLVAHSTARRVPLCTVDRRLRDRHSLLVRELR
jgi:PIN domain nuclease of toxin-antitoxin system